MNAPVSFYPAYRMDGAWRAVPGVAALLLPAETAEQLAVTFSLRMEAGHLEAAPLAPIEALCAALLRAGQDNIALDSTILSRLLALVKEGRVCGASHLCAD